MYVGIPWDCVVGMLWGYLKGGRVMLWGSGALEMCCGDAEGVLGCVMGMLMGMYLGGGDAVGIQCVGQ